MWRLSAVGRGGELSGRVGGWCLRGSSIRNVSYTFCGIMPLMHAQRPFSKTFTGGKGGGGRCQGAIIRGMMCLLKRTDAKGQMESIEILTT